MQALATSLIVILAFVYVAWRYLPRAARSALLRGAASEKGSARLRTIPIVLASSTVGCGSGCSACSGCANAAQSAAT